MIDFDTRRPLFKNARLKSLTRYLGARKKGKSGERGTRGTGEGEIGWCQFFVYRLSFIPSLFSFSIFSLAVSFPQTESSQARATLVKRFKSPWRKETHKISQKFWGYSIS